jgi:hypothetical protein
MFRVRGTVPDHILQEHLQDAPRLLVDEAGDPLGDPLDVVPEDLPVALGTPLSQSLSSFLLCRGQTCLFFGWCRDAFLMRKIGS